MKKVAVDLTWVRHGKVGGTESCVRNLLDSFAAYPTDNIVFVLLLAKDNSETFLKYDKLNNFEIKICDVRSSSQKERVFWQNFKMHKVLKNNKIAVCLEPIYGKPFFNTKGIDFITTIHDLQAYHYPEYFSKARVLWMKLSWWNAVKTSKYIIAISKFVRDDIISKYRVNSDKIKVIYDVVEIDTDDCGTEKQIEKYNVLPKNYYYTVSSLLPHKNLSTLIKAMALLKKRNSDAFRPLVISGVGGKSRNELEDIIKKSNLEGDIIFTPFINDTERNTLYKYCRAFLFPSIFEGFGMPPIEAMCFGVPVLTTDYTSLGEITSRLVNYVQNPLDETQWSDRLNSTLHIAKREDVNDLLNLYSGKEVVSNYYELLR